MYVSLAATHIGSMPLVAPLVNILGNRASEDVLLSFLTKYQFDSLSLYNLSTILSSPIYIAQLTSLMAAARACGVVEINAIGSAPSQWNQIKATASGKFDGLVTEIEFWNTPPVSTSFQSFISQLQYMKSLGITPPSITPYIGWLNNNSALTEGQEAAQIAANTTRVFTHAYVRSPVTAYDYTKSRVLALHAAAPSLPVWPIFSAEGSLYRAGSESFMGDWLANNGLDAAEAIYKASYVPAGFQYFEYSFLKLYLK